MPGSINTVARKGGRQVGDDERQGGTLEGKISRGGRGAADGEHYKVNMRNYREKIDKRDEQNEERAAHGELGEAEPRSAEIKAF